MAHAIIRGGNGRSHEVDFGTAEIVVSLHASGETVELAIEAGDPDRPSHKLRIDLAGRFHPQNQKIPLCRVVWQDRQQFLSLHRHRSKRYSPEMNVNRP